MNDVVWKILLVEDDEEDYMLTRALLSVARASHFELLWVKTYEEAMQRIQAGGIDAVLVDQYLGSKTGLNLIREVVASRRMLPVILLTGNGSEELDVEAAQVGATDYLVKGEVSPPLLERTIRYAISRSQIEQEMTQRADHIEMQHRLIQQSEQERLKIAQDLHDGPLQEMIGLDFALKETLKQISGNDQLNGMQPRLNEMLVTLQQQINDLRAFCGELRPPALAPFGLEKAIRSHAQSFGDKYPDLTIELNLDHDGQRLPEPVRLAFYRIYQELMSNIVRHAQATQVSVNLRLQENQVELEVRDNGQGFKVPQNWLQYARQGHMGLVGVRERADSIGGTAKITSRPDSGTTVQVTAQIG